MFATLVSHLETIEKPMQPVSSYLLPMVFAALRESMVAYALLGQRRMTPTVYKVCDMRRATHASLHIYKVYLS